MSLQVLKPQEELLRKKCMPLSKKDLKNKVIQKEIDELVNFVYGKNNKGEKRNKNMVMTVGLSANQVGIDKRVSVVDLAIGRKKYSDIHVLINPEIIWKSKTLIERSESCINLPNVWGIVKRSKKVKVKALDRSGNELLLTLVGWPAILLQHETDHLNGKLFIDKLQDPKRAHLVKAGEYKEYKKGKEKWERFIDVSRLVKK
jgi:peptide deformylase